MDDETSTLLAASLRELLTEPGRDVARGLAELGWDDVVADDEAAATTLLFTEQGQVLGVSSAIEDVARSALRGAGVGTGAAGLPADAGLLFGRPGGADAGPGAVDAVVVRPPAGRPLVAVTGPAPGPRLLLVATGPDTAVTPVTGIDEALGWWAVRGPVEVLAVLADGGPAAEADRAARAAAARALSAELCGLAAAMLDRAVAHVRDRRQFGRALGSFQAVRHDLADALVHLTAAREAVDVAWLDRDPWTARCAWSLAVNAHAVTARHAMQVSGAMGLSWEHDLHRYVRRGMALEALLGSGKVAADSLGAALLAGRPAPRVPAL